MYTKFSAGSINYDLVCTSDYMVERLINEDQVLEINLDDFEYYKNLDSSIIEASQIFDPENKYSMPYFYGTLGILYNTTMVSDEEVSTWNVLWDEAYKDSIIMPMSSRQRKSRNFSAYSVLWQDFGINQESIQRLEPSSGTL